MLTIRQIMLSLGLFAFLSLSAALYIEKRSHAKARERIVQLTAKLHEISTAKNEQRTITKTRIVEVERKRLEADKVAERIEKAPLEPGACKTPGEILGADL